MLALKNKSRALGLAGLLAVGAGLGTSSAWAGAVVGKPTPHGAGPFMYPEFGTSLARSGSFTLVGALQEHVSISGEAAPTWPSIKQGAVYLMRGTNATPERLYQFPGVAQYDLLAGSQVAISSRFLAFGTGPSGANSPFKNSIFIARNVNGSWGECPLVNGQRNCNGSVRENGQTVNRPLTRIPLTRGGHFKDINIALSDDYLAIGYKKDSIVEIYRYDATLDKWVSEFSIDEPDERATGAALAIDGDRIAVSSPWNNDPTTPAPDLGSVRVFRRNSSNVSWNVAAYVYGSFSSGAFGRSLTMGSGTLAVTSGPDGFGSNAAPSHLSFFRVATDGTLSARQTLLTAVPHVHLGLQSDTLVSTVNGGAEGLSVYKRDTSTGVWAYETGLIRDFYKSVNVNQIGYGGIDPVGIVGDDLVLGWRSYNTQIGSIIHEKVSLLDNCRDPLNLVTNCSFDSVTNTSLTGYATGNGWQLLNWNGGSAWADYTNRQLRINVQQPGSDMWHVQARTTVNLPQSGRYRLSFRAKADAVRSFVVNLGRDGNRDNNWTSYGRVTASAGPNWVIYSFDLTNIPQDSAALLDFNVGNAGTAAFTLDSVKLVRLP